MDSIVSFNRNHNNMSRCVCCDNELNSSDYNLEKLDGSEEDLCSVCRSEVYNIDFEDPNLENDHEYLFEFAREGVKEVFIED